jgi:hypothetical protein
MTGVMALVLALAAADGPPQKSRSASRLAVGACEATTIARIGSRLDGVPDSGIFIAYADGVTQVSYEALPGAASARPGDAVTLCLQSRPADCPKGDDRGGVYAVLDTRTGERWTAADSSHLCGGA